MSMEKMTKEELLKKLGAHALSDEELEQVCGGKKQVVDIISHSEDDLTLTENDDAPDDSKF